MELNTSRTIKNLSLAVTIINSAQIIMSICGIVVALALKVSIDSLMDESSNLASKGELNAILGLTGIFGSIAGYLIVFIVIFFCGAVIVYYLAPCISGIVVQKKAKNQFKLTGNYFVDGFLSDGIIKIVFNGLIATILMIAIIVNIKDIEPFVLFIEMLACGITGLSVYQVVLCRKN